MNFYNFYAYCIFKKYMLANNDFILILVFLYVEFTANNINGQPSKNNNY